MSFDYGELRALSEAALACPNPDIRESAADTLRCLSSYESFTFVKRAIREVEDCDVYSIFILCKSLRFVVCNELGPAERKTIQSLVLSIIHDKIKNTQAFQTPPFIYKALFGIYACGLFLNWRIMLINSSWYSSSLDPQGDQQGGDTNEKRHLGQATIDEISNVTGADAPMTVLQGLIEVITTFLIEDSKGGTKVMRTAICTELLPSLLQYGSRFIASPVSECARLGMELCTLAFESTSKFAGVTPLLVVQLTTEDSRYLHPATAWLPPLQDVASFCNDVVMAELSREPPTEQFLACLSLLQSMSTAQFSDWRESSSLLTLTDGFMRELVMVAAKLIEAFANRSKWDDDSLRLLEVGISVMTNVFERNDLFVGSYVANNMAVLRFLCGLCHSFIHRINQAYRDGNPELVSLLDKARSSLLHLFFVIGEKGIPPKHDGDNTLRTQIVGLTLDASTSYYDSVIQTTHLQPETYNIDQDGFLCNMDQQLAPLAEMLFSDAIDLLCVVDSNLSWTLSLHATCVQLKGLLSSGKQIDNSTIDMEQVNELDGLCQNNFGCSIRSPQSPNLVLNVLLSRLSVVFALIGLSVKRRSEYGPRIRTSDDRLADFTLVNRVIGFAESLISADHDITHMLLECMTMTAPPKESDASGGNLTDEERSRLNAATRDAAEAQGKLHLGILRALFYFSLCVHSTPYARQCSALDFMAELILFTVVDHNDCIPLVHDANKFLKSILEDRTALTAFPQIKHLLDQHIAGQIVLTRPDFTASDPTAKLMRHQTLTNLVQLSDYRVDSTIGPFMDIVCQEIEEDFFLFLEDVAAICAGVVYALSHKIVIRKLAEVRERIVMAIKEVHGRAQSNADRLRLASAVATCWSSVVLNCYALLEMENVCMDSWAFAGLCFDSLNFTLQSIDLAALASSSTWLSAIRGSADAPIEAEGLIYDLCSILRGTFLGKWCNIGVMLHYGDDSVQSVFIATITQISKIPVEILVSNENKVEHVYSSIHAALTVCKSCGALGSMLKALAVWGDIAAILTHCIEHQYHSMALTALHSIVIDMSLGVYNVNDISYACCTALITTSLSQMDVLNLVEVIEAGYKRDPDAVSSACNYLLDISSAIHRVRIRTLLTSLTSPTPGKSVAETYLGVFGTGSDVATVAAW